ncbi:MAG: hypothetical protein HOM41_00230, partial [Flavobacteriales bacterium]|nr:hypothetical protein [Flavobacteriales bacterium]
MSDYVKLDDEALSFVDVVSEAKVLFFTNTKTIALGFITICLLTGLYLYNTPKQYVSYAKIKVLEEQETSAFVLEDMLNFSSGFKDKELLNNEIEVITSKNILEQVIQELNLSHRYTKIGVVNNESITHSYRPFTVSYSEGNPPPNNYIIAISGSQNRITNVNKEISKAFSFGETIILGTDTLIINKSTAFKSIEDNVSEYSFKISSGYSAFQSLKSNILLEAITDVVLGISIKGTDPVLNVKIIESLLKAYDADGKNDSKLISEGTSDFLRDRVNLNKSEIEIIESSLSEIKKKNDFIDITAINALFSDQKTVSNDMSFEIETQSLLAISFLSKLESQNTNELLPLPIEVGISNSQLSSF